MFYCDKKEAALKGLKDAEAKLATVADELNTTYNLTKDYINKSIKFIEKYSDVFSNTYVVCNTDDLSQNTEHLNIDQQNSITQKLGIGTTAAGIGVATLGPSALLAAVSTFGTASTGVAISTLSGAAATNAALAAIGGGTIAAGGGGIAAGTAVLSALGPIGFGIAAIGGIVCISSKCNKNKTDADSAIQMTAKHNESIKQYTEYTKKLNNFNEQFELIFKHLPNIIYLSKMEKLRNENVNYQQFDILDDAERDYLINETPYHLSKLRPETLINLLLEFNRFAQTLPKQNSDAHQNQLTTDDRSTNDR